MDGALERESSIAGGSQCCLRVTGEIQGWLRCEEDLALFCEERN